jgi:hypothetical protein
MLLEMICGLELPSPLAGTGECTFRLTLCQLRVLRLARGAGCCFDDCFVPRTIHNPSTLTAIPARFPAQPAVQIRVMACFPKIPYRSGTSRNDPAVGPIPPISAPPESGALTPAKA